MDKKVNKKLIKLQSDFIDDVIKIADEYNIDRNKLLVHCTNCLMLASELGDFSEYNEEAD
jgi:hypothetical protein